MLEKMKYFGNVQNLKELQSAMRKKNKNLPFVRKRSFSPNINKLEKKPHHGPNFFLYAIKKKFQNSFHGSSVL